jgi:hypothetical protein
MRDNIVVKGAHEHTQQSEILGRSLGNIEVIKK